MLCSYENISNCSETLINKFGTAKENRAVAATANSCYSEVGTSNRKSLRNEIDEPKEKQRFLSPSPKMATVGKLIRTWSVVSEMIMAR